MARSLLQNDKPPRRAEPGKAGHKVGKPFNLADQVLLRVAYFGALTQSLAVAPAGVWAPASELKIFEKQIVLQA